MKTLNIEKLDWEKMQDLIPAIIQDSNTRQVLMLGYMNPAALDDTLTQGKVTFYSRSKSRLWMKGETSGNTLEVVSILQDCDNDSLLLQVKPTGPTCHEGTQSCFGETNDLGIGFLAKLQALIQTRYQEKPENSYTTELFNAGINRCAQKVGEEGVEVALAAVAENEETLCNESADLLYHLLVVLQAREIPLEKVLETLKSRHKIPK